MNFFHFICDFISVDYVDGVNLRNVIAALQVLHDYDESSVGDDLTEHRSTTNGTGGETSERKRPAERSAHRPRFSPMRANW